MPRLWCALLALTCCLVACSSGAGPAAQRVSSRAPSGAAKTSVAAADSSPAASAASAAASHNASASSAVVLVIDGSGSMVTQDVPTATGKQTRLSAAQGAADSLIAQLPAGAQVGLFAYGQQTGSSDAEKAAGCKDVTSLAPVAPLADGPARKSLQDKVAGIRARGYTSIGLALEKAVGALPAAGGTVVLVSDGADTCAPPDPCATAKSLVNSHSHVSISTVGLLTDSAASLQLSCIASSGKGVFVTAANTQQLVKRLSAATDPSAARTKLTSTGIGSVQLGQSYDEIAGATGGFPGWGSGAKFEGTLTGVSGNGQVLTVIVWLDCSYIFDSSRKLVGIQPHQAGTVDGVGPGSSYDSVRQVYGDPLSSTRNPDGSYTTLFAGDAASKSNYQVTFTGDPTAGGTVVKVIYLCRCAKPATWNGDPSTWKVQETGAFGPLRLGMTREDATALPHRVPGLAYADSSPVAPNCGFSLRTADPNVSAIAFGSADRITVITLPAAIEYRGIRAGSSSDAVRQAFGSAAQPVDGVPGGFLVRLGDGVYLQLAGAGQVESLALLSGDTPFYECA